MYDLSSKFNTFYRDYVVLPQTEKTRLYELKDLNISRLNSGIAEYNEEKKTNYKMIDNAVQGSVAMSTVTQNDNKEYDIDVAVIFDKDNIPSYPTSAKNMVCDSLKKKCKQFKAEPEARTNAVRLEYVEGYHVDFAVYRYSKDDDGNDYYEHCGSEWRQRDPWAINEWFNGAVSEKGENLRKIVRLLKMFNKSRDGWLMPAGIVTSVLCDEQFIDDDRLDVSFYETICAIRDRLKDDKDVKNPVDDSISLLFTKKDEQKVKNLHSRLTTYISKLDILFDDECTEDDAISAWNDFFQHSYWDSMVKEALVEYASMSKSISSEYDVDIQVVVEFDYMCIPLEDYRGRLPKEKKLRFTALPKFYGYDKVEWVVSNSGDEAEDENDIFHSQEGISVEETTKYRGKHKMTCNIYKYGRIVCSKDVFITIK